MRDKKGRVEKMKIKEILNRPIFNEIVWKFYNEKEDIQDKVLESIGDVESQAAEAQCYVERENISVKVKRGTVEEWQLTKERKRVKELYASGLLPHTKGMTILEYSSVDGSISKTISSCAEQIFCYEINDDALENTTKETADYDNISVYDSRIKKDSHISHEKVADESRESYYLDMRSQPTFYQLKDNSIDLVIVYDEFKFYNKYEIWAHLVEMKRVLKPGGRIDGFLNIIDGDVEDREQFTKAAEILKRDKYYFNCMRYINLKVLRKVCEYSDLYLEVTDSNEWGHFRIIKPPEVIHDMRGPDYNIEKFLQFLSSKINCSAESIVEIGSYAGHSSTLMCEKFGEVYCIDPWAEGYDAEDLASYSDMQKVESEFDNRVAKFDNCRKLKMLSSEAVKLFKDNSVSVVYIDGDHRYDSVKSDILEWYPKIKNGGFIAGHDYDSEFLESTRAIKEIFGEPQEIFPDHTWLVRVLKDKKQEETQE